ncbi:MAG: efflux RND transporter periplasmic adaptor subunit [Verrucomicrobia bacterium]|nr:efflux RND transporter periplasmic adaptor subunit [Verrucomicrobiota bacterium]
MKTKPILLLLAGIPALFLAGCGKSAEQKPSPSLPVASVRVQTAERKLRVATEETVGTVRARQRAVIEAKITGRIDQLLVAPGQQVKAGDMLVIIDAREVQARHDQARAVQQQAENDLKRLTLLLEQKVISPAEFDASQSKFRVAEAAAAEAGTMLSYTKVTAPFAGVITRKHTEAGDLAAPGKPLLEMEDSTMLRLEADVPEAVVGKLTLNNKLSVRISALEKELEGVVSEIAPAADAGSRTFLVKLDLPPAPGLRAGQFGRVAMPVGETSALRVPASAVVLRGQMEMLFVAHQDRAQLRLVKTGKRIGGEIEVVSGLEAGETIVVEGAAALADGQPLSLKP